MALEININELIDEFKERVIFLTEYESTDRILNNEEHNYNLAKKVAGRINKIEQLLLSSSEGTVEFLKLLEDDNLIISANAAQILYPIKPKKCINILKQYAKSLSNELDRHKIDCIIKGFIENQEFFVNLFQKIYKCENLDSLNMEK